MLSDVAEYMMVDADPAYLWRPGTHAVPSTVLVAYALLKAFGPRGRAPAGDRD